MSLDHPSYLSLFSGIGGLDRTVEAFGFRCVGQVEWDRYCQSVLDRHWPGVPRWGDIREFGLASLSDGGHQPQEPQGDDGIDEQRSPIGRRELLAAGVGAGRGDSLRPRPGRNGGHSAASGNDESLADTDRQPARRDGSGAPRPEGEDAGRRTPDERDGPPDAPRGAVTLVAGGFPCQPVSSAGRRKAQADDRWLWPEFARVVGELRPRLVLVENVRGLLSAGQPRGSAFGEVVGTLADMGYDSRWGTVRASDAGACHRRERVFLLAHADRERLPGRPESDFRPLEPGVEASRRRDPDGLGACSPHSDLPGLERRAQSLGGGSDKRSARSSDSETACAPDSSDIGCEWVGSARDRGTGPADGGSVGWGQYLAAIQRWERVMGPAPAPLDDGRLSADFVEWMMGFPAGWTAGGKRTERLKALGNAVVSHQAVLALSMLGGLS